MAWTEITRHQYRRDDLAYASDIRDREWALLVPLMPPKKQYSRPRRTELRRVVEAALYIVLTGCQWRALPHGFSPYTTVQGYLYAWLREGRWDANNHVLVMLSREQEGREATPSVGILNSQSVKTAENGGPKDYDAGKKIKGKTVSLTSMDHRCSYPQIAAKNHSDRFLSQTLRAVPLNSESRGDTEEVL